jgi:hypothetical protein
MDDISRQLFDRSKKLLNKVLQVDKMRMKGELSYFDVSDIVTRTAHLVQSATGPKSAYAVQVQNARKEKGQIAQFLAVAGVLQAFHFDLAEGHVGNIRHEVETIVVSEILSQARKLRKQKGVHPAAAIMVAGAATEEFLRNWCAERSLVVAEKQRSISAFAAALRKDHAIDLPTERRIQSWADYRNDAAHGDRWAAITPEVADRVINEVETFLLANKHVLGG